MSVWGDTIKMELHIPDLNLLLDAFTEQKRQDRKK